MTENHTNISLAEQYSATLDWWRDAGVDYLFEDEVQSLLEEQKAAHVPASPAAADSKPVPKEPAVAEKDLPGDLAAFRTWWMESEALPSGSAPRIAPKGAAGAPLMLIAPMPEIDDGEQLLAGPQGKMLGNLTRALGHAKDAPYVASALPSNITLPDWDALTGEGIGAALRRHIELAKPKRVVLFGSKLPALLGHDASASPETLTEIAGIPAFATFAPERLLDHPRQRARLWHRLLEWTA